MLLCTFVSQATSLKFLLIAHNKNYKSRTAKAYLLFVLLQKQARRVTDRHPTPPPPPYSSLYQAEQKCFPCIAEFTISLQSSGNSRSHGFPQFSGRVHRSRKGRRASPTQGPPDGSASPGAGAHQRRPATDGDTGPLCAQTPLPAWE